MFTQFVYLNYVQLLLHILLISAFENAKILIQTIEETMRNPFRKKPEPLTHKVVNSHVSDMSPETHEALREYWRVQKRQFRARKKAQIQQLSDQR